MIGEDSPVPAAELVLHTRQVIGGSGHGSFRIQAVVTQRHRVRRSMAHHSVNWLAIRAAYQLAFGSDLEAREPNHPQTSGARRGFGKLHDAFGAGRTYRVGIAPAFEIRYGGNKGSWQAAGGGGAVKNPRKARTRDSLRSDDGLRLAQDSESFRLDHAVGAIVQHPGRYLRPVHAHSGQPMLRSEIFRPGEQKVPAQTH